MTLQPRARSRVRCPTQSLPQTGAKSSVANRAAQVGSSNPVAMEFAKEDTSAFATLLSAVRCAIHPPL